MSLPGRVYVRMLPPIVGTHESGMTRETLSEALRVKMLEGIKLFPKDAGDSLTWTERGYNIASIVALVLFEYWLYNVPVQYIISLYGISFRQLLGLIVSSHVLFTICFYAWEVYIKRLLN